jgi:hypothetical protein
MKHYLLTQEFNGLELYCVYCNTTDKLLAAFANAADARKWMYSFYKG